MAILDEENLRELMHRSTGDLHAPAGIATAIVGRQRRRAVIHRAVGFALTGAAAGTAFGVIASGTAGPANARIPAIRLTAAQQTLSHLSSVAAAATRPAGRYAVLKETQDGNVWRTSVIDSKTGDVWTFQHGPGVTSELPLDRHGSLTEAQFNAMTTNPAALRSLLIHQYQRQQKQAIADLRAQARAAGKQVGTIVTAPNITDDDIVFDQATDMLWNPLVSPALRSALFKVLENTPGVVVNAAATDADGRPAIEISRVDSYGEQIADYENPATAAVLEASFTSTAKSTANKSGWNGSDLYLSITSTNTPPTDNQYSG